MRYDVFKVTTDDWCPSHELTGVNSQKLVKVSFVQTGPTPPMDGEWRVCVWGKDDIGMERDFTEKDIAFNCFLEVIKLNDVTVEILESLGFINS